MTEVHIVIIYLEWMYLNLIRTTLLTIRRY